MSSHAEPSWAVSASASEKGAPAGRVTFLSRSEVMLSDSVISNASGSVGPVSIAEIVRRCEPMGDLTGFVIDDLVGIDEDEFFAVLEDA